MARRTRRRTPRAQRSRAAEASAGYERIVARFLQWAEGRADIHAAVVVGSRARADHPADEWADLDLVMFVEEPARYAGDAEWVRAIGTPWITFLEPTAVGGQVERRVLFEGGLDVDFALISSSALRAGTGGTSAAFAEVVRRGSRVLFDREGLLTAASRGARPRPQPMPTERDVLEVVSDFWYHAVWTAKHLRRGELWWAKGGCDGLMKELLRRMMEWHARIVRAPGRDTWMRGRFLEEWADPRAKRALRTAFAHYDEEDVWHSLFATMDLFRWISRETMDKLGFAYPAESDRHATELVQELYAGRAARGRRASARAAH